MRILLLNENENENVRRGKKSKQMLKQYENEINTDRRDTNRGEIGI